MSKFLPPNCSSPLNECQYIDHYPLVPNFVPFELNPLVSKVTDVTRFVKKNLDPEMTDT